jgi:DNA-binding response OmpR family regulator
MVISNLQHVFMEETVPFSTTTPAPRVGVLVADDEPSIRSLLSVALRAAGFTIRVAANGQEAIDLFRQHANEIQLVLLDVQMPELDGVQTLSALRKLRPGLLCCFMSGNPGGYMVQDLLDMGAAHVFAKPFSMAELTQVLRQLVSRSERRAETRLPQAPVRVTFAGQPALLRDRSTGGLGLWVTQPAAVGSVLALRFEDPADAERPVEVRHCHQGAEGWALGCRFMS